MEILWWLAPAASVSLLAMGWVAWLGRAGRGEVDRDAAVARLARALEGDSPVVSRQREHRVDRSTGIAVRPSRAAQAGTPAERTPTPAERPPGRPPAPRA